MVKLSLLFATIVFCTSIHAQYGFDTVRVYFDIGKTYCQKQSEPVLDSIAKEIKKDSRGVLIYGYADYLGEERPNQSLSDARAEYVKNYLLKKSVTAAAILTTTGVGQKYERIAGENGNYQNRKVEIFIRRKKGDVVRSDSTVTTPPTILNIDEVKKDETLVLQNISFYESTHRIKPESEQALYDLLEAMREHPSLKIQIEGHICCVLNYPDATDAETGNLDLSLQRAKFVRDFLVKKGIDSHRLTYKGFGRQRPIVAREVTKEDQQRNRRVEVRIVDK